MHNDLTFKKAAQIFLTSNERGITINFFKGKELLVGQLFKSADFEKGEWEGFSFLKKNSNILMLHFNDEKTYEKFKNNNLAKRFIRVRLKDETFYVYNFSVSNPFRAYKLINTIRKVLNPIYEFNEKELLEFEVVTY